MGRFRMRGDCGQRAFDIPAGIFTMGLGGGRAEFPERGGGGDGECVAFGEIVLGKWEGGLAGDDDGALAAFGNGGARPQAAPLDAGAMGGRMRRSAAAAGGRPAR